MYNLNVHRANASTFTAEKIDSQEDVSDNDQICKVPMLSLETDANKHFFRVIQPLVCPGKDILYLQDLVLRINRTALENVSLSYCIYRGIHWINDFEWSYSKPIKKENNFELKINNDCFRVQCYTRVNDSADQLEDTSPITSETNVASEIEFHVSNISDGDQVDHYGEIPDFDEFFVQIYPKNNVLERISQTKPLVNSTQMNVLMFGFDSMSHMSYQRLLPKTYAYLKDTLKAVILDAYNIVGDGTVAALVPILTGNDNPFGLFDIFTS